MRREHVLDVKLRSDRIRAGRMKLAAWGFGTLFATVFGIYIFWRIGDWALDKLVYENPSFAIQNIEVQTDGIISADQLRRWAGVRVGQNLLALDLAAVRRNLELASAIRTVSIERILPSTLSIRVTEREPVVQVNVPRPVRGGGIEAAVFHLDMEGCVMQPLDPRQRTTPLNQLESPLPVLAGVNTADLLPGRRVETPQIQAALRMISQFEYSPMAGLADLQRIDVGYPEVLIVTTGEGSQVTLGLQNLDWQLRRWREIHDTARAMNKIIGSLDLAVTNNLPVTWMSAESAPAPAQKPARPARTRRRNV